MSNITNELMYELLKEIQGTLKGHSQQFQSIKEEMLSMKKYLHNMQGDALRREQTIAEMQVDIDRIKTRLDLSDA